MCEGVWVRESVSGVHVCEGVRVCVSGCEGVWV